VVCRSARRATLDGDPDWALVERIIRDAYETVARR